MKNYKKLFVSFTSIILSLLLVLETGMVAEAANSKNGLDNMSAGVTAILDPEGARAEDIITETAKALNYDPMQPKETSTLVMANVKNALNVRREPNEESEIVGKLYKDCGGTILERRDGWTKLQSGNIIGWCKDEYLLFDEEARALANDVGNMIATSSGPLYVRTEPGLEADIHGLFPKGEITEVVYILDESEEEQWVCVDFEGKDGFVAADFVKLDFKIDSGETIEEIKAREAAEQEAKRNVNYGEHAVDADTTMLLAALIQCEAGGESYEGQLAVGAVVMNRVRSGAYPNSVHGVIYASGQFTPALNGKVNTVYSSGKISASCIKAAEDALAGNSNVGDLTHFRRNNGRDGLVIGNHVFY